MSEQIAQLAENILGLQKAIAALAGVVQSMATATKQPDVGGIDMSEDEEIAYVLQHNIDPLIYLRERREKQNAINQKQSGKTSCKKSKTSCRRSSAA